MIYFKNINKDTDLELEEQLFSFNKIPIIFICNDKKGNRYLCQCTDTDDSSWLITQVNIETIINLIHNDISMFSAFKNSNNNIIIANRQKDNTITYKETTFKDISEDELPDKNEKLDNNHLTRYISYLESLE